MSKFLTAAIVLAALSTPTGAAAQSSPATQPTSRPNEASDSVIALAANAVARHVPDTLLTSIVTWLSTNFDLQPTTLLPRIKYASVATIAAHRNRALLGADGPQTAPSDDGRTTVAIYDRGESTIYLPLQWTGTTPAEVSVLVHEMVHHLQNVAQTRFECPQAHEELAYAAQQRWLGLFGRTLEAEFQIDPFTLLVTTRCMY